VTDVLKEGDSIQVKLMEIDHLGRLNLAALDSLDANGEAPQRQARSEGRSSDHGRESRPPRKDAHRER
jgi:predicted RNA-binding protein with RPS1 domain